MDNPAMTYIKRMASNPTNFVRQTELWAIVTPLEPQEDLVTVLTFSDYGLTRPYPMDAAFVSKFILTKAPDGKKALFIVASNLIGPMHLATMLDLIDFDKIKFDRFGYIKGEFAAPATKKFGILITGDSENPEITVLPNDSLVDTDGQMILLNSHEGNEPDWVYNWSMCFSSEGVHLVALTAGGKLLKQVSCGNHKRYLNITPPGVEFVNDVVSIPRALNEPDLMIATTNGLIYRGDLVPETSTMHIDNLCYDSESQALWIRTREGKVYRSWFEGGKLLVPEEWSRVNGLFSEVVSHKLLCGPATRNPVLTAWGKPVEIMKGEQGTGKFTVRYDRMEVPRSNNTASINEAAD